MRRLPLILALFISGVAAGDAAAKEVIAVKACGPSDCRTSRDRDVIGVVEGGGQPSIGDAATKSGWYSLRARIRIDGQHDEHFSVAWVPRTRMLRMGEEASGYAWTRLSKPQARGLRRLVRGMEPFPAAKLRGASPPEVRVDEIVLPAAHSGGSSGGASAVPWIAGGVALIVALLGLVWRRRGFRRPRPTEG
jgi:hypothetical protein